jgi:hypothetical protein
MRRKVELNLLNRAETALRSLIVRRASRGRLETVKKGRWTLMKSEVLRQRLLPIGGAILPILALLLTYAGYLAAQAIISAGPLLLYQVRTIYVAPSSDDFVLLFKARLEKWTVVVMTSKPEEADAILTCQTQSTIVPAKVVVHRTIAEVTLVDRRSQKLIWRTTKSSASDRTILADDIMEQLKQDWRKSAIAY